MTNFSQVDKSIISDIKNQKHQGDDDQEKLIQDILEIG